MAVRAPGIGGGFLQAFLDSYRTAEEMARREREGREVSALRRLRVEDYLRQRGEEQEAHSALGDIVARQRGRVPGPGIPVLAPEAARTPERATFLEANAPGAFPVAQPGGGSAELIPPEAARPPVLSTVLEGIEPAKAARLLTQEPFRRGLKSVEEAEEERRREEDRLQAREFRKAAGERIKSHDFTGWLDNMAAAARREGDAAEARRMTERILTFRQNEALRREAEEYTKAVVPLAERYEETGEPEDRSKLARALTQGSPEARALFGQSVLGNWARDVFADTSLPRPVQLIQAEWGQQVAAQMERGQDYDGQAAYEAAFRKYPLAVGRYVAWMRTTKGLMDPELEAYFRRPNFKLDAEQMKDVAGRTTLRLHQEGLSIHTPKGLARYFEIETEEAERLRRMKETPLQRAQTQWAAARTKALEAPGKPLEKMSAAELSLDLQRAQRARKEATEQGDEVEIEAMRARVKEVIAEQQRRTGVASPQERRSAEKLLSGRRYEDLAPEERQAVLLDVAQRLFGSRFTHEQIVALPEARRRRILDEVRRLEKAGTP